MEQIKESFKHDYNLAVRSFNEKDYKSFFRNIRPAMELLGQLSIYDILGESDAVDLLEGDTSVEWKRDAKIYKISQYPSHHKPTGREFCELVPQVFYSKNTEVTTTRIDEKKKLLLDNGVALWDVAQSCEINGSSDSSMKNVRPNDIYTLLYTTGIDRVFANGKTAARLYERFILPQTDIPITALPSTSPANAAFSLDDLCERWRIICTL